MVESASFLSVASEGDQTENGQDSFLEHSYNLFTEPILRNISPAQTGFTTASCQNEETLDISFISTITTSSWDSSDEPARPRVQLPTQISTLRSLPQASHIFKIKPQTITVNLIVGVISITPARSVQLRHSARSMDIIEVLVGDDTSAGFSVTFWLPPLPAKENTGNVLSHRDDHPTINHLRKASGRVRSRDVVLLRNVALSVFQGRVHGQSLNAKVHRNETRVEILDGNMDGNGLGIQRAEHVSQWVLDFLGPREKCGRGKKDEAQEELPPNTLVE
jgi:hypothetical protein